MRSLCAMMVGALLLLCGCTVPDDDDVSLERFCSGTGREFQDGEIHGLMDGVPCARGIAVEVRSHRYGLGCVRITVQREDGRALAYTSLRGQTQVAPDKPRGLRILLPDGQETTFRLYTESFERDSCTDAPSIQFVQLVDLPNGTVRSVRVDAAGTDADFDSYASVDTGGTDCDDSNPAIHPYAFEQCDGVDSNCADGDTDAWDAQSWYLDQDGDGYGIGESYDQGLSSCVRPAGQWVIERGDCNDQDPSIHPNQSEFRCDGHDDNCNDSVDEHFSPGFYCTTSQGANGIITCDPSDPTRTQCIAY